MTNRPDNWRVPVHNTNASEASSNADSVNGTRDGRLSKFVKPEPNFGGRGGKRDSLRKSGKEEYGPFQTWQRVTILVGILYAAYCIILVSDILPKLNDIQMEVISVIGLTLALMLAGALASMYGLLDRFLKKGNSDG